MHTSSMGTWRRAVISAVFLTGMLWSGFAWAADVELSAVLDTRPLTGQGMVGATLQYIINVHNYGSGQATGVVAAVVLPDSVDLVSCSSGQGTSEKINNTVTTQLGTLGPNSSTWICVETRPREEGTVSCHLSVYNSSESGFRTSVQTVIYPENTAPVISMQDSISLQVGQCTSIVVLVNDVDRDVITLDNTVAPDGSEWTNGIFTWTASPEYAGTTNLVVFVADDHRGTETSVVTATLSIAVSPVKEVYVSPAGSNIAPYASWETAATNLQTAVAAAGNYGAVFVASGTYQLTSAIQLTNAVLVRGMAGNGQTTVKAAAGNRCFNILNGSVVLDGFTVMGGEAVQGGGILMTGGLVQNCTICSNVLNNASGDATNAGGGVAMLGGGTLRNSVVRNNTVKYPANSGGLGAAIYMTGGKIESCTIAWNTLLTAQTNTSVVAGYGNILNTIVHANSRTDRSLTSPAGTNVFTRMYSYVDGVAADGNGNIDANPKFLNISNDFRLCYDSPCKNTGSYQSWMDSANDWRGKDRIRYGQVDIGAIEFGLDDIEEADMVAAYVSPFGSHVYPYDTWDTAATNIQDAVDAADAGAIVLVTNGTYLLPATVMLTNDIILRSVNGAENTIIDGQGTMRCVQMDGAFSMLDGFTVQHGYSASGAGIYCMSGRINRCTIQFNNGGAYDAYAAVVLNNASLNNSKVIGNQASGYYGNGGGVYACQSLVQNCLIARNYSGSMYASGGGIRSVGSDIQSCTIVCNSNRNYWTGYEGGGVSLDTDSRMKNCILYSNLNASGYQSTTFIEDNYGSIITNGVTYCLARPLIEGEGNSDREPVFVNMEQDDYRLVTELSPGIDSGTNQAWMTTATDIQGYPRILNERVNMGAYEFDANPLVCLFSYNQESLLVPSPVVYSATLHGTNQNTVIYSWDFNQDGIIDISGQGLSTVTNIYTQAGNCSVSLTVSNAIGETYTCLKNDLFWISEPVAYVSLSGSHTFPFTNWIMAATNVQSALDAVQHGAVVYVTNGEYQISAAISIDRSITLRSMNGWSQTVIRSVGSNRCVTISNSLAVLDGFTLTGGQSVSGGGVQNCGTVQNCLITGNKALVHTYSFGAPGGTCGRGGGVYNEGGTIRNSLIISNTTDEFGAYPFNAYGSAVYMNGGIIESCTLVENRFNRANIYLSGGYGAVYGSGISRNNVFNNNAGDVNDDGIVSSSCVFTRFVPGEGNIYETQPFVSAAAGDYRLRVNSIAVNAGTNQFWMTGAKDFAGNPRIQDGIVDIGAFETGLSEPSLKITIPNQGDAYTAAVDQVVLKGLITGEGSVTLAWSNTVTSISGFATVTETNGAIRYWMTPILTLSTGLQEIAVSASFAASGAVRMDMLSVNYQPAIPGTPLSPYPAGTVYAENLRVDTKSCPAQITNISPCFSWELDDELNGASSVYTQLGYRIQVATSLNNLLSGSCYWDSGVVSSPDTGDGINTLRMSTACNGYGPWYWRVKLFSSSGYQSDWSEVQTFTIETNDLYWQVTAPGSAADMTTASNFTLRGWVAAWSVTSLSWTNINVGVGGEIALSSGAKTDWSQVVPLHYLENNIRLTARGPFGESVHTVMIGRRPSVTFTQPGNGGGATVYSNVVYLAGSVEYTTDLSSIMWTNLQTGASGLCTIDAVTSTGATWHAKLIGALANDVTYVEVRAYYGEQSNVYGSASICFYYPVNSPAGEWCYPDGAVSVSDLRVNGQRGRVSLDQPYPNFSWTFGDLLNQQVSPSFYLYGCASTANNMPKDIAMGDVTGDGLPDMVVANYYGINYYLENSGGTPNTWASLPFTNISGNVSHVVRMADFNGDGKSDLLFGEYNRSSLLLINTGGRPSTWPIYGIGYAQSLWDMEVGDVNLDGRPDILFGNENNQGRQNYVVLNNGGLPGTWPIYNLGSGLADCTRDVTIGDVNGDGYPDVVVGNIANYGAALNYVLLNNGGTPDTWPRYPLGNESLSGMGRVTIGDFTADGKVDVLAAVNDNGTNRNVVWVNNGGLPNTWARQNVNSSIGDSGAFAVRELADMNGDGLPDFVEGSSVGAVNILFNNGMSISTWTNTLSINGGASGISKLADFNRDGRPDVMFSRYGWGALNMIAENQASKIPYGQYGYKLEIYCPVADTNSGATNLVLYWDSGYAISSNTGNGINTIRPSVPCTNSGDYVWRVKGFSVSRYQSPWSVYGSFQINPSMLYLRVDEPSRYQSQTTKSSTQRVSGWASPNVTGLIWSNALSGAWGAIQQLAGGSWTGLVALADGVNPITITARGSAPSVSQSVSVTFSRPVLKITTPAGVSGDFKTDTPYVAFGGWAEWSNTPAKLCWSNLTARTGGSEALSQAFTGSVCSWRSPLFPLNTATQKFRFWMEYTDQSISQPDEKTILYGPLTIPESFADYPTGLVTVTSCKVNGMDPHATLGDRAPTFSWMFGDALNTNTPAAMSRVMLGGDHRQYTFNVAVGDLNGDGWDDVVQGNGDEQNVVFLNNHQSPGTWERCSLGSVLTDATMSVDIGDLNDDGRPDVVVGNEDQPNYVLFNNGNSPDTWTRFPLGTPTNDPTMGVTIGDLDGDGRMDVSVSNEGEPSTVFFNNGNTPDTWSRQIVTIQGYYEQNRASYIGDVNGDGRNDLIVARENGDNRIVTNCSRNGYNWLINTVYLGNIWEQDWSYDVVAGDLNADSRPDVVVANYGHTGLNYIFMNNGGIPNTWERTAFGGPGGDILKWTHSLALVDINGDGRLDILNGDNVLTAGAQNYALINNGGHFSTWSRINLGSDLKDYTQSIAVGDFDRDGRPDVVVGNGSYYDPQQSYVLMSSGNEMSYRQAAYQVQVSRSATDWAGTNALVWDSGVIESENSAIQQAVNSDSGTYYWRVKVFSTSRMQSDWSAPMSYTIPTGTIFLTIYDPPAPFAYALSGIISVQGWVSTNATNVYWRNETTGVSGFLGRVGTLTQTVSLATGTNVIKYWANTFNGEPEVSLTVVRCTNMPGIVIAQPSADASIATELARIGLAGSLTVPLEMLGQTVRWSNETTGVSGTCERSGDHWPVSGTVDVELQSCATNVIRVQCDTVAGVSVEDVISVVHHDSANPTISISEPNGGVDFTRTVSQTSLANGQEFIVLRGLATDNARVASVYCGNDNGTVSGSLNYTGQDTQAVWQTPPIVLHQGTNRFTVWAVDTAGVSSPMTSMSVICMGVSSPGDASSPGAVYVSDLRVNNQYSGTLLSDIHPKFSWKFGDALNTNSILSWSGMLLGLTSPDITLSATIADINGDNRPDIVIGKHGQVFVMENNGGAVTNWPRHSQSISGYGCSIAVSDVTGDGLPDVVCGGSSGYFGSKYSYVFINNGCAFNTWSSVPVGPIYSLCAAITLDIADLTGDGRPDLMMNGEYMLVNNGGTPDTWPMDLLANGGTYRAACLALADVNGDERVDFVMKSGSERELGQLLVLLNDGTHPSNWVARSLGGNEGICRARSIAVGDLNRDGRPDVVVGNGAYREGNQNYVYMNNGGNPETWECIRLGSALEDLTVAVQLADLNGDSRLDVIVANGDSERTEQNYVLLNNGGSPDTWVRLPLGAVRADYSHALAVGDLNGDGRPDVFVGNYGPAPIGPPPGEQDIVWMNQTASMPNVPWKYQVQVARSISDLEAGNRLWDSGWVTNTSVGDGVSGIRQETACDGAGDYYSRVRTVSSSRYMSPWSDPVRYTIPDGQLFLSVQGLAPVTYISDASYQVSGWVSWNATNLTCVNTATNSSGSQCMANAVYRSNAVRSSGVTVGESGTWTQDISIVEGINQVIVTAYADNGAVITQQYLVAYRVPIVTITAPEDQGVTVYQNALAIEGTVTADDSVQSILWSNLVTGATGSGRLEWFQTTTSGYWRVAIHNLAAGTQKVRVWAVNDRGTYSLPAELDVDYEDQTAQPSLDALSQGAVYATQLRVNRQLSGSVLSTPAPCFQWQFGDALNEGSPTGMTRNILGSSLADWTRAVDIGDLTGDGLADVVVGNDYEQNYVLVNNGGAPDTWTRYLLGSATNDPTMSVVIADVTGDGRPDAVIGNLGAQNVVLVNNGASPETWSRIPIGSLATNDWTRAIAVADVTGDGLPDILVGNDSEESFIWVNNNGHLSTWPRLTLNSGRQDAIRALAVADVTGDEHPDIILGALQGLSAVLVNEKGTMPNGWERRALQLSADKDTQAVAIGDVNHDGLMDIALGCTFADPIDGGQKNVVFLNNGDTPDTWSSVCIGPAEADYTYAIAIADVNADGREDVLVCNGLSSPNAVILNNGGDPSTWNRLTLGPSYGDSSSALAVGDLNGDGRLDVVVGNVAERNTLLLGHAGISPNSPAGYRIQIAFDDESFDASSILWDSGWVASTNLGDGLTSVSIPPVLQQSGRYFWRVQLASSGGYLSDWSSSVFAYEGIPVLTLSLYQPEVEYEDGVTPLFGSDNGYVSGSMIWSNSLTGETGTIQPGQEWDADSVVDGVGTNVITITATNRVGVTVTATMVVVRVAEDIDGNGLPNWWEQQYFNQRTGVDSTQDMDLDGADCLKEYLAGTNPWDCESVFSMDQVSYLSGSSYRLTVQTQPGYRYTIYYSDGIINAMWRPFANAANGVGTWLETASEPSEFIFEDSFDSETTESRPAGGSRYYRIKSEKP